MGKYDKLGEYLSVCNKNQLTLNMKEIEIIIGDTLPPSAHVHNAWWSNEVKGHLHARSWVDEGYKTIDVKPGKEVTFIKIK